MRYGTSRLALTGYVVCGAGLVVFLPGVGSRMFQAVLVEILSLTVAIVLIGLTGRARAAADRTGLAGARRYL
jgi:hypothetical protein